MTKKGAFKKRSRYLAMLMAMVLVVSNVGTSFNIAYAAETGAPGGAADSGSGGETDDGTGADDSAGGTGGEDNSGSGQDDGTGGNSGESNAGAGDEGNDGTGGNSGESNAGAGDEGNDGTGGNSGESNAGAGDEGNDGTGGTGGENNAGTGDEGNDETGGNGGESNAGTGEEGNTQDDGADNTVNGGKTADGENQGTDETAGGETGTENGTGANNGTTPGATTPADKIEKEDESFEITYVIDPEEGAKVKGPKKAEAGDTIEFTVKPESGYVIGSVEADNADVTLVEPEEAGGATPSEAVKADASKMQRYRIESVDEDTEIVIYLEEQEEENWAEDSVTLDDGVTVSVKWNTAVIPESAALEVQEVTEEVKVAVITGVESGNVENAGARETATVTGVIAYDIRLVDGDDEYSTWDDGAVTVTFSGAAIADKSAQADEIAILHVEEGNEILTEVASESVSGEASVDEVSFEAEHFSVYAVTFVKGGNSVGTITIVQARLGAAAVGDGDESVTYNIGNYEENVSPASVSSKLAAFKDGEETLGFVKATMEADSDSPAIRQFRYNGTVLQYEADGGWENMPQDGRVYFWYNAGAVVNASMGQEEIQAAVIANPVIRFEAGTYSGVSLQVEGGKTFIPLGDVILSGNGKDCGINISGEAADLTFEGGKDGSFTVTGYRDGINVEEGRTLTLNIAEDSTLHLDGNKADEVNHGNGIWAHRNTTLNVRGFKGATFTASDNQWAGVQQINGGATNMMFEGCELVEMSRNESASGYHAGAEEDISTDITFDGCTRVSMDENGWDAINFQSGGHSKLNIIGCGDVSMARNEGWGTNGGDIYIDNSKLNISGNAAFRGRDASYSNMYCFTLTAINSTVNADGAHMAMGVWVAGEAKISGTVMTASQNGVTAVEGGNKPRGYGFYFAGNTVIDNGSKLIAEGNTLTGMQFGSTADIDDSQLFANNNRNYGIVFGNETTADRSTLSTSGNKGGLKNREALTVTDSYVSLLETAVDGIGHDFYSTVNRSYSFRIQGDTVARIDADKWELGRINGMPQYTYMLGGSLQAVRTNMQGGAEEAGLFRLNGTFDPVSDYAGPVNAGNTMLTRFNLNQELNREVGAGMAQAFTYSDPNTGETVNYSFRYNTGAEDLTGEGGNAYVWAPVSILHYDATQGNIPGTAYGTAQQGNVELINTRGDGSRIGNAGNPGQTGARYGTDYTVFGNSMNLSEAVMPSAARDGYKFLGWFAADDEARAAEYAASGNWDGLYGLLNTEFTGSSKVASDLRDVTTGQAEKTVYAKWALPNEYTIKIYYLDKDTNEELEQSYTSASMKEGAAYDIDSLIRRDITNYTWESYSGDQTQALSGTLGQDLVFYVYYTQNTSTGNNTGGGGGGGGSSTGGRRAVTEPGGPGITINPEAVPLAPLPEGVTTIPEEDVPLIGLPKTGESVMRELVFLMSGVLLGAAVMFGRKRKED